LKGDEVVRVVIVREGSRKVPTVRGVPILVEVIAAWRVAMLEGQLVGFRSWRR
jgi:hypothetical protein